MVGVVVYQGSDGTSEVRVTHVYRDPECAAVKFADKQLLGPVGKFLRRESHGTAHEMRKK